jgi:glycosyltransferase involved in cell wall biosynthesis/cell division protein FtsB
MSSIAVITRTKNRPLLLERALKSVLAQTRGDWVHVVVNDGGAPEPVEELAARYAEAYAGRLKLVHNPVSLGMEAASNAGIRACESACLVIHDDDDRWDASFLETMAGALEQDSHWAGAVCHSIKVLERIGAGGEIEELGRESFNASFLKELTLAALAEVNQFPPIAFLYRRSAFEAIGPYREDLPVLGDWEFNLRFLQAFEIRLVPQELSFWHHRAPQAGAAAAYGNSVTAGDDLHRRFDTRLRNEALRDDLRQGRTGIGFLMNAGRGEIGRLRREVETLHARLAEAGTHAGNLEAVAATLRTEVAAAQAHGCNLERTTEASQAHIRGLEAEREASQAHIRNLEAEREASQAHIRNLEAEREASQAHIRNLEAEREAFQAHIRNLEADRDRVRRQLEELLESTSWKIGAPLRWLGKTARR